MLKHQLINIYLILTLSACVSGKPQTYDSNTSGILASSLRIKRFSDMPNLVPKLAKSIEGVDKRRPKQVAREVISKTLVESLIQNAPGTTVVKGDPQSISFRSSVGQQNSVLVRTISQLVHWKNEARPTVQSSQLDSYSDLGQVLAGEHKEKTQFFERTILHKAIISDLLLECYREITLLRSSSTSSNKDQTRILELEALINTLEPGFVPLTPPELSLDKTLAFRENADVSLKETLNRARKIDLDYIKFSRAQILPTPEVELIKVLNKSEKNLIDSMGSSYYWFAKGSIKTAMPILNCVLAAVKLWADCRQDLKNFDAVIADPKIPRVAGEVFRGMSAVPIESIEQWLTLAAKGQPLHLGPNNSPESSFASRVPEIALEYMGDVCRKPPPNTVDVLLVINQREGVSVETILSLDERLMPIIISKRQKFKLVEVFKTHSNRKLVIKLEEI